MSEETKKLLQEQIQEKINEAVLNERKRCIEICAGNKELIKRMKNVE